MLTYYPEGYFSDNYDYSISLLQDVKKMSHAIRGNSDSGNSYLLGYVWASLTPEQQKETFDSFKKEFDLIPRRA